MDEIADCIADHQYGEAIRKSGVGDPLDALASSILEKLPEPPVGKDPEEPARLQKEFVKSLSLEKMLEEPIGRFMLASLVQEHGVRSEGDLENILTLLNDLEDYEKLTRPDFMDARVVCDQLQETCPSDYLSMLQEVEKKCDDAEQNGDAENTTEIPVERVKTARDAAGERQEVSGEAAVLTSVDMHDAFSDLKNKLCADLFGVVYDEFLKHDLCIRYRKLKWYCAQQVIIDNFVVFRDLGRGAFGVVSGGRLRTTGQMVALKGMNRKLVKGKKVKKLVKGEKEILKLLGERPSLFCVWLKYSFSDAQNMYFALPLMTGGDLQYHLRRESRTFGVERTRFFAAEILLGLAHMHSLGIVYRDLKPENVLLDDEGHTRISDLGLAVDTKFTPKNRGTRTIKGKAGTPGYWPPQMILNEGYAFDADWWSFGCCVYEFMAGSCPFSEHNTKLKDRNDGTLNWDIQFPDDSAKLFPEELKDLCLMLLKRDVNSRAGTGPESADLIMKHPFFEPIDWKRFSRHQTPPPWAPPKDAINAVSQADLEDRNKEHEFRKLKLTEEDNITQFEYVSTVAHQRDICTVLKLERMEKLGHLNKSRSSACSLI